MKGKADEKVDEMFPTGLTTKKVWLSAGKGMAKKRFKGCKLFFFQHIKEYVYLSLKPSELLVLLTMSYNKDKL
jgi:hypothetical protein